MKPAIESAPSPRALSEPGRERLADPERTCIVTRAKRSPDEMIRFVVGPGQMIVPDIARKLPGRGVWVTAEAECIARAVKRQAFSRSFKTEVSTRPSLVKDVESLLETDCLQALSMANKAGLVVTGFTKVERAIASSDIAGLIHASDGGADGMRKLWLSAGRHHGSLPRITQFSSRQLDLALGRSNVIHAVLIKGVASEGLLRRCRKLALYSLAPSNSENFVGTANEKLGELGSKSTCPPGMAR